MSANETSPAPAAQEPRLIVGIGASAGGLEPLERFFAAVPADTGMAFVVLQHLSPDFESRMDELLGRQTRLPIHKVTDGIEVGPDQIYLIPPKKEMIIAGGKLLLTDKDDTRGFSLPIDHFFRSLAHEAGRRAVAIVLSGAGSDGSRGIRDVRENGGLVLCQVPETARFQGMPLSARQTGAVDAFLPPDQMPAAILAYLNDPARSSEAAEREAVPSGAAMEEVIRLLRAEYGIDFNHYKPTTVIRRIERRLALCNQLDVQAYARLLATDASELNALYRDLLIGVTRFFRDAEAFELVEKQVVPAILAATSPKEEIRVWVAGCATGEEAYSLAILFHEQLEAARRPLNLKIFATDVHRHSLDVGSAGLYTEDALGEVTPARRERYFVRDDHRYRVAKDLRQLIVFARHNVITDAPFTRLDLVSCRNLLIYFQPLAQKKALSLFHFGMKTGGTLLLGPSETPGELGDEFDTLDPHWRVYRKRRDARLPDIRLTLTSLPPAVQSRPMFATGHSVPGLLGVYDQLLDRVMPPSVLLDEHYQLVHSFGGAEKLLHVRPGRPSNNVLDMVEEGLKPALLGALQHAYKERKTVRLSGVPVRGPGGDQEYRLSIDPVVAAPGAVPHFLVSFESKGPVRTAQDSSALEVPAASRDYVNALESELRFTKESLQATIEELETSNEELQATNEELVASNEELQSTNEELHSVNEELYTVNIEHQRKITQLAELTDDLDGLLHGIDVGVLFLDEELCIRKYTAQAARVFRLLPQDVGRRLDSFAPTIQYPNLEADVVQVLRSGQAQQREVTSRDGVIYLLRILPHRSRASKNGVVVLLVDVSELKRSEARVRRLSSIVESSSDAISARDAEGRIIGWNRGAEALYGWSAEEAMGRDALFMVPEGPERAKALENLQRAERGEALQPYEALHLRKDGSSVDVSVANAPVYDEHDVVVGVSSIARDITQRRRDEAEVRRALLMRDQFMAMLSHELRNPLAALLNACALLENAGPPERKQRAVQIVGRQCRHMARLLDDLLDVSRMRQDEIELRKTNLDFRATVEAAVERIRPAADAADLRLDVEMPATAVEVYGDADRLQQVEVNLLTNAIKYTPQGGSVRLTLGIESGQAVLRVSDTGTGIAPHMLERIFEPFVRAVEEEKLVHGKSPSGMGLGLALVRSFVRAHGGEVRAFSQGQGQGSEFVVRLPLAEHADRPALAPKHDGLSEGESIVLVEDQEDNRMLLSEILSGAGYVVLPAADGKQAIELIEEKRPRVAVVDLGLPVLSGYDVARDVRTRLQRTDMFLVALTGYGQQQDREAVLQAGFDQHLVKPVDIGTLLDVLRARRTLRVPAAS
jgi:two-component system, chemotaxis family, CheB/CheR fusion protein